MGEPLRFAKEGDNPLERVVGEHRMQIEDGAYFWRESLDSQERETKKQVVDKLAELNRLVTQVTEPVGVVLYPPLCVLGVVGQFYRK
jgi:hypothetical protein